MDKEALNKEIVSKLLKASKIIADKARKSPANFIVASKEVSEAMQDIFEEQRKRDDRIKKLKELLDGSR